MIKKYKFEIHFGFFVFSIATAFAILFQKLFLPLSGLADNSVGLLGADALYYHAVALDLSARIREFGWFAWSLYPSPGATGNTALLAALYAIFDTEPAVIIPFNAAFHALSAVLVLFIAKAVWNDRLGHLSGICTAILLTLSPSALLWYGQVNKDGFYIAGLLLVIWGWLTVGRSYRHLLWSIFRTCLGVALCLTVRPYSLLLIGFSLSLALFVRFSINIFNSEVRINSNNLIRKVLLISIVFFAIFLAPKSGMDASPYSGRGGVEEAQASGELAWRWEATSWLPASIDRMAELVAKTRVGLIIESQKISAGSNIAAEQLPSNAFELLMFVPRALQVSMLAPFPSDWLTKFSIGTVVAVLEIGVWYLLIPGVIFELVSRRNNAVLELVAFSVAMLVIYGVTIANLGTLHRIRFPYLLLMMLVGFGGWAKYLHKKFRHSKILRGFSALSFTARGGIELGVTRNTAAKAGSLVMVISAMTFLGFFLRDVLMARAFGLGLGLDAFVMASVLPMFMVAVFSVPLSTAVVPFVVQEGRDDVALLVSRLMGFYGLCALLIGPSLYSLGMYLLYSSGWGASLPQGLAAQVELLSFWMLLIFIVSGFLTIANGVLNALGNSFLPAASQLLVPVVAIASVQFLGERFGVIAVPVAMFFGQALNLVLLVHGLKRVGVNLWPLQFQTTLPRGFLSQYVPLVVCSIFLQISAPVSTLMATSLPGGDLSALGLGGKLVVFITSLISVCLSSVVLPYLASILVNHRVIDARRELSFLLMSGTVASIPLSIVLYLCARYCVSLFYEGGLFAANATDIVASVMRFGILQLPFFFVNIMLVHYAIARRCLEHVLIAAAIGFIVNIFFNFLLIKTLGVSGVALSMSISVAISACLMLFIFFVKRDIGWFDLLFILLNWLMFVAIIVCLNNGSWAGLFAMLLAYVSLLCGGFQLVARIRPAYMET